MEYQSLNLDEKLKQGLQEAGYVTCTPVQEEVLGVSLDGSDLYVQSQTGTGKTAAYLVTILQQMLARDAGSGKKALVMVPTRELAVQVEEEAEKLGKYSGLKFASFYGGVGYEKQVASLKKGVDIIIGTPGRLIDLHEGRQLDLSQVAFLVIDEADRMFDMGFYPDLRKIIKFLPASGADSRQTMLFSATLNSYVKNLAWEYTKDAKEVTIEAENITVDEIDQELLHVSSDDKVRLLVGVINKEKPASLMIFCNTKNMCEVLSKRLEINGIKSEFIIGDLPQSKRLKIMDDFKAGKINCLVATDVAARGIDVNDLAMVINFDLPNEAENYVHRIGRTARAGKSGKAYTFCSEQDVYSLVPIERYIEKSIPARVAVEEDLGEDKSAGTYIKTGNWREDDRGGSRDGRKGGRRSAGERRGRPEGRKSERSEKGGKTAARKGRSSAKSAGGEKVRATKEDLSKMAGLSFEERMKLYKEKYATSTSSPAAKSGKNYSSAKKSGGKKNVKNGGKNFGKKPAKAPVKAPAKKTGFFGAIKALFSKR